MKLSRMGTNRNVRRAEKIIAAAVLSAAGLGSFSPVSAAVKTWAGTVFDPASVNDTVGPNAVAQSFVPNTKLYQWNTSVQNWSLSGAATTWASGDSAVFTDNFSGGTFLEVGSAMGPVSVSFVHATGTTPTTYVFISNSAGGDFINPAGGVISSSSPFSTTAETLTLDTGFLGTVIFRHRVSGATGGSVIVKSGTLELDETQAVPGNQTTQRNSFTLSGGTLAINVTSNTNIAPGSGDYNALTTVTADSTLALTHNAIDQTGFSTVTSSRTLNGSITFASPVTLSLISTQGIKFQLGADLSTVTGTMKIIDPPSPAAPTVVQLDSNGTSNRGIQSGTFDLGTGASILQNGLGANATYPIGFLLGGPNTTLRGSNTSGALTTYAIGSLNVNNTFNGIVADNGSSQTNILKVGNASLNLNGVNTTTGTLTASGGILAIGGANGSALNATYAATSGGIFEVDNSVVNKNDRLGDTNQTFLNQGTFQFIGNQTNETTGTLNIAGASFVKTVDAAGNTGATISFQGLVRTNGIVNFDLATNSTIHFNPANVPNNDGILGGFATVNNFTDWASLDANNNVGVFTNYNTNPDPTTWTTAPNDNIKVTTNSTINLPGSTTINSLDLAASSGAASLVIPAGNGLAVKAGGILANSDATISGAGTLTAGDGTGPIELDVLVGAGKTLNLNSVIADNGASGVVSLQKAGPGTLVLGASNTFSGTLSLAGGTLSVGQTNLLSPTGGLTVDLGTTFDVNNFNQAVATISLLNGTIKNSATASFSGGAGTLATITVSGLIDVRSGTISTNLAGAAPLVKSTGGTVTLTGSNSYTGGTTVTNGTLNVNTPTGILGNATFSGGTTNISNNITLGTVLGNGGTIATANSSVITANSYEFTSGTTTVTAILAGSSPTVGVVKDADSNGSVVLNGLNTFTGAVTIQNQGTIAVNTLKDGGLASSVGASPNAASNLVLDGGFLVYTGAATSTNRLFTVTGNNGTLVTNQGNNALVFTNTGAIAGGGLLTLRGSSTAANTINSSFGTDPNNRPFTIAKNDGGVWVLASANFLNELRPNNGVLTINANQNVNVASFQGGTLGGTGVLTVNNLFNPANGVDNVVITGNASMNKQVGSFTINTTNTFIGGDVISGGVLNVVSLVNGGLPSSIGQSSNADSNLRFDGQGTISYIGAVATSTDRMFQLNSNNSGFASDSATAAATLTIAGTPGWYLNNNGNTLVLGGGNGGASGLVNTFVPSMYNNGGLTKVGGGAWTLTGTSHTYTGPVTLGGGTLVISSITNGAVQANLTTTGGSTAATVDNATGIGTGQFVVGDNIAPGTTIAAISGTNITLSQPANNGGTSGELFGLASPLGVSQNNSDRLVFNGGTLKYTGPAASTDRRFNMNASGGIDGSGTGALAFTNTAPIDYSASGSVTLTLSGSGTGNTLAALAQNPSATLSVTKSGTGQWSLTNANNSYTGVTTLNGGTLTTTTITNGGVNSQIGAASNAVSNIVFGGGALQYTGGGASTDRLFTMNGNGTIDSSGANTGSLQFTSTGTIVDLASGTVTLGLTGTNTSGNTIAANIANGFQGNVAVSKSGIGAWTLTGSNSYSGVTAVSAGTLNLKGANAWAPALAGTSVSTTGGTVLTGGRLNFDYTGNVPADPANTIKGILTAGAPGNFLAGQIRTTTAADGKHAIGWIDDTANSKVRVGYTYLGDANVDGIVNTLDFNSLAANFNVSSNAIWSIGDFNYDGKVNALDFNMLASNFGAPPIAGSGIEAPSLGTLVPEPASLGLLASIALLGVRRRRTGR